jgi:hypothetical protein
MGQENNGSDRETDEVEAEVIDPRRVVHLMFRKK